ncbi:MAG: guanylate kinase [Oscillospiraceae bacterium]|nr:guanylate kinase [Oscillospiraceae bacterium]
MGKSAVGKDTIYQSISCALQIKPYVPYTTRPMREHEENGREYYFVTQEQMREMEEKGNIVEMRKYNTVFGDWYYFSTNLHLDLQKEDQLGIGTLESYMKIRRFFGKDAVIPIYIEVPNDIRLMRSIQREKEQDHPNFSEVCRRYLADEADFAEEKLKEAEINKCFQNLNLDDCIHEITAYIRQFQA